MSNTESEYAEYMTVEEIAAALDTGESTVWVMLRSGELRRFSRRIGTRFRTVARRDEVEELRKERLGR